MRPAFLVVFKIYYGCFWLLFAGGSVTSAAAASTAAAAAVAVVIYVHYVCTRKRTHALDHFTIPTGTFESWATDFLHHFHKNIVVSAKYY